ncbi:hypothetical protein Ciccas_013180 [Cichlidogyrus casuarinus]|uniref:Neurotransmitter-gated ion-channel ligand-binding domain-containing protein n=1 Tax=Cichlidogyrus casuarinus TaxID=1844966 RepID=A0ABD2PMC3_9PLAT
MLMTKYRRTGVHGRPITNRSQKIKVLFRLALNQIIDLDETLQVLLTNCWAQYVSLLNSDSLGISQEWTDPLLSWDPKDYGGIDQFRLKRNNIWTPDINLLN